MTPAQIIALVGCTIVILALGLARLMPRRNTAQRAVGQRIVGAG